MLLSSAIFLGGFISWVKFWRVPGNDVTMNWMVAAGIMEFIYIISTGLNSLIYREETKGESTKKDDDKEEIRLYSMRVVRFRLLCQPCMDEIPATCGIGLKLYMDDAEWYTGSNIQQ